MNEYFDSLLEESGHKTINELLETMDQREANAQRDELHHQLEEIENLEKQFFEAHGKSPYMDRLKMPFDEAAFVAEVGTSIKPILE